ncbi:TRI58 ligase, partial [Serilophus lunatus]|nr:TRI58 ligase [Serilophus lunatus]
VTLDADTAHPRLEISADGRRVTDSGVISISNEERLNSHPLVKEGYTSGRHYWEEYVGSRRSWALGVALESVTHKGPLTLSPENGFWVIACADGKDYWAYTDPWTPVSVSGKPELIGILLDLPFKQVTFYDVHNGGVLFTFGIADGSSQEGKFIPFSTGSDAAIPDPELLEVL